MVIQIETGNNAAVPDRSRSDRQPPVETLFVKLILDCMTSSVKKREMKIGDSPARSKKMCLKIRK